MKKADVNNKSIHWKHSNNEKLYKTVQKYWQGNKDLTAWEIGVLSAYLEAWIRQAQDYPKKKEHILAAIKVTSFDDIKYLSNQLINWGVQPW